MSDETKIFTKNDKNGDKCASGGQESGLKLIFERGVAILVRPWRFPGQPKKFVFFSIKVGTINSGTSLDSREQFKKTGKLENLNEAGFLNDKLNYLTREIERLTARIEMLKTQGSDTSIFDDIQRELEIMRNTGSLLAEARSNLDRTGLRKLVLAHISHIEHVGENRYRIEPSASSSKCNEWWSIADLNR